MKTILFLLALPLAAQSVVPCYLPTPATFPAYFRVDSTSATGPTQCEAVAVDTTTTTVTRAAGGALSLTGNAAVGHLYSTALYWPFLVSQTTYTGPGIAPTGTPFDGQFVWCPSTSQAGLTTYVSALGQYLPAIVVETRNANGAQTISTTGGVISATNPANGSRFLFVKSSNACSGNPGLVFAPTANSIVVDGSTVPSTLMSVLVIGLL